MRLPILLAALFIATTAQAQWTLLDSRSTADFRGVDNVGNGIVWVSGSNGTILRSTDNGKTWQHCTTPPDADKLDFRGIQAFDANTAIAMSSGPGNASRLYKTADGCNTWKLVATNPDVKGFWDSFRADVDPAVKNDEAFEEAMILGDSVDGNTRIWEWKDSWDDRTLELAYQVPKRSLPVESSFAASNSVLQVADTSQIDKTWKFRFRWASGTTDHAFISYYREENTKTCEPCRAETGRVEVPMADGSKSAGIFSFSFRSELAGVAVGGDYTKPNQASRAAAITSDGGLVWKPSRTFPHGYRSAVAYDPTAKAWITVGPNGTDISTDDGRNWRALTPTSTDPPDADKNWNALSLPFVVGPHGRIGILRSQALKPVTSAHH